MTAAPASKPLEYTCKTCSCIYTRERYVPPAKRNCDSCQSSADNAKRKPKTPKQPKAEKYFVRLQESSRGLWMIQQCRRAGTVQTFEGATAADLHALEELLAYRKNRYGWVNAGHAKDSWHVCHVQPLKAPNGNIGISYGCNVFVGPSSQNQKQGNKLPYSWAGRSIPKTSLLRKYKVEKDSSDSEVFEKLRKLLGKELEAYLNALREIPALQRRKALAKCIYRRQGTAREVQALDRHYTVEELLTKSLDELQELDSWHRGKTFNKERIYVNCIPDSDLGVLYDELKRFSGILPLGQHRDNCEAVLPLLHVLGMQLFQSSYEEFETRPRFSFSNAMATQLQYHNWQQPLGTPTASFIEADQRMLKDTLLQGAYDALQGLQPALGLLRARLHKRITVTRLLPYPRLSLDMSASLTMQERWQYFLGQSQMHFQMFESAGIIAAGAGQNLLQQLAQIWINKILQLRDQWLAKQHPPRHVKKGSDYSYYPHWGWDGSYPEFLAVPQIHELLPGADYESVSIAA